MPELPEVHTTATGLQKILPGLTITDAWTDYGGLFHVGKDTIKNPVYFKKFKKLVIGQKVISVTRRAKNVLINILDNHTILVHMKMTGHLMYGDYSFDSKKKVWLATKAGPLRDDPFNKRLHFVITLSNGKHVVLSDTRKFAKVILIKTDTLHESNDLKHIGPEPLEKNFTLKVFKERLLRRPNTPIKQALMDQALVAGIGNIYSDEMLWLAGIHPLSKSAVIEKNIWKKLYVAMKKVLSQGIDFGGDSMSDYRNVHGLRGAFQHKHNAYRRKGLPCKKSGCNGTIQKIVVGGRSTHFCNTHQKLFK